MLRPTHTAANRDTEEMKTLMSPLTLACCPYCSCVQQRMGAWQQQAAGEASVAKCQGAGGAAATACRAKKQSGRETWVSCMRWLHPRSSHLLQQSGARAHPAPLTSTLPLLLLLLLGLGLWTLPIHGKNH